jgi:hypothetical protein
LNADHGADHAAVDVDVADARGAHDLVDEALDAAVDAEGEAVAGVAQPLQDLVGILAAVGADVKDRPEHFDLREFVQPELKGDRGDVVAARRSLGFAECGSLIMLFLADD